MAIISAALAIIFIILFKIKKNNKIIMGLMITFSALAIYFQVDNIISAESRKFTQYRKDAFEFSNDNYFLEQINLRLPKDNRKVILIGRDINMENKNLYEVPLERRKIATVIDFKNYSSWQDCIDAINLAAQTHAECKTIIIMDDVVNSDMPNIPAGSVIPLPNFMRNLDQYHVSLRANGDVFSQQEAAEAIKFAIRVKELPDFSEELEPENYMEIVQNSPILKVAQSKPTTK